MKNRIKKLLPDPQKLKEHKYLAFVGHKLGDPSLWHFNRKTVPAAFFAGLFTGYLPIPFQMVVAALLAIRLRCNLPLSVALVWFSNPLTYVPVFYAAYRVGAWTLGLETVIPRPFEFSWLLGQLLPLWVGSLICGLGLGGAGYITTKMLWRISIVRSWEARREKRKQQKLHQKNINQTNQHNPNN